MRAFGYVRVSTDEQAEGLSLASQRRTVLGEIERRGWTSLDIVSDQATGTHTRRPGLNRLLARLAASEGDALVVGRLDRLTRSPRDFYLLMDQAAKQGWSIVVMDPAVDMTSPFGRAMAGMAAVFAQLESELIGQRQRESVMARRRAGTYKPAGYAAKAVSDVAVERIRSLASLGFSSRLIAEQLDLEGFPAPRGAQWSARTVRKVLQVTSTAT